MANDNNKENRKLYYSKPEIKTKYKNKELLRSFGISLDDYNKMLEEQNGVCKICQKFRLNKTKKFMPVDHCHTTGKIRGILCNWCNRALGLFEDNNESLNRAINYLNKGK